MTYQESMFDLETMQRRDGTTSGHLRLPSGMTRGDCVGGSVARSKGEQSCPFLCCKYHLVPELVRLRPKGAIDAMARRLSGEVVHSCVLDLCALPGEEWSKDSSTPQGEQAIGDALGIDRQLVSQRTAEALNHLREGAGVNERVQRTVSLKAEESRERRRMINRALESGDMTEEEIMAEFGVSKSMVRYNGR